MISSIVKYCAVFFCVFFVYTKSQNENIKKIEFIIGAFASIILGIATGAIRTQIALSYSLLIYLAFPLIYSLLYHIKLRFSLITSILAFGFSYAAFSLACIPVSIVFVSFHIASDTVFRDLIVFLCIAVIQISLTLISMKSNRIKKGLAYLIRGGVGDVGIYISIMIFLIVGLLSTKEHTHYVYIIPIALIMICSVTLFFWRKNQITKLYIDQSKNQEIDLLERTIEEKDKLIETLRSDNDNLSQIIHKDNKLIPAMITAMKKYLSESDDSEAADVLSQLESIYEGRMNAVKSYELSQKKQPSVGISSTDAVIFYMQQKAAEFGVNFDLCISADVVKMTENVINKDDLNTLLADLIENAIIATREPLKTG